MRKVVLPFLRENAIGTLVTLSPGNTPHTATVYVHVDDDFNCYCLTKATTQKFKNVKQRANVALSVFNEKDLKTCEIFGSAYTLSAGEDIIAAITNLQDIVSKRRAGYGVPPVSQLRGDNFAVIKITPSKISFSDYSEGAYKDTRPKRFEFNPRATS